MALLRMLSSIYSGLHLTEANLSMCCPRPVASCTVRGVQYVVFKEKKTNVKSELKRVNYQNRVKTEDLPLISHDRNLKQVKVESAHWVNETTDSVCFRREELQITFAECDSRTFFELKKKLLICCITDHCFLRKEQMPQKINTEFTKCVLLGRDWWCIGAFVFTCPFQNNHALVQIKAVAKSIKISFWWQMEIGPCFTDLLFI